MIRMDKVKRGQLIPLILGSALVLGALWYGLIFTLQQSLEETDDSIAKMKLDVERARRLAQIEERLKADLASANERLQDLEVRMATGDAYRWAIRTFQGFAAADKVNIISLEPPREQAWGLIPAIPYQAANYSMTGTAYYHDFGKFLSDLENSFPHLRVVRLDLEPAHFAGAGAEDAEKLTFKLDFMILVNPVPTHP